MAFSLYKTCMIKRLVYLILLFLFFCMKVQACTPSGENRLDNYLFKRVTITGSTNLNHFQLSYSEDHFSEIPTSARADPGIFRIDIPVKDIDAESRVMLEDFLRMIHAEKYPEIEISLNENVTNEVLSSSVLDHSIGLTINGITNTYVCHSTSEECYPNQWCLSGKLKVRLSDFEIEPPKKFFGIVKVGNEVFVNFRILFSTGPKKTKN